MEKIRKKKSINCEKNSKIRKKSRNFDKIVTKIREKKPKNCKNYS